MARRLKAAVLTVSDTRDLEADVSGNTIAELLARVDADVVIRELVTDDLVHIRDMLASLVERDDVDLIFTTGGTGFGPRDNTPEATRAVIDREAPGIAEAMRRETAVKTPMAMLSRGVAGIRGKTLIINFPGSPKAVTEYFEVIRPVLRHAVDLISGNTKH
jgi:molybdopterin adenylyltransferase